ncbi:hypothetical protein TrST_g1383 [Triparma strigata]|uniref:Kinesin-like protein n=1 Tax=Triparma strigata TaxID=1606541 RepID=A0A9W7AIT4_9STRA|nr:hypothetical protein TrST_g1383 [Triparma strigata]
MSKRRSTSSRQRPPPPPMPQSSPKGADSPDPAFTTPSKGDAPSPASSSAQATPPQGGDESISTDRMLVLARVRPLNQNEKDDEDAGEVVVYVKGADDSVAHLKQCIIGVNLEGMQNSHKSEKEYRLDGVFAPDADQEEIFNATVPLLRAALSGYNATIFTYGQTGTGKTHTMLGHDLWALAAEIGNEVSDFSEDRGRRGIIPRALQYVFKQIRVMESATSPSWLRRKDQNSDRTFMSGAKKKDNNEVGAKILVSVSYTEIYNEKVRDLLAVKEETSIYTTPNMTGVGAANLSTPSKGSRRGSGYFGEMAAEETSLEIREDKNLGIVVPNLTEISVESEEEIFQVLWKGAQNRAMASTNMNERSSRSHTILGVRLTVNHGGIIRRSKINLVDLAGSERYKTHQMAQFSEQRIKELTSINQSLSALGNCISALTGRQKSHVPYRNSKLTRLLQDSLGGNCRTMFIVTVSPSAASCEETISTLQFADRAMKVRVFATSNERLNSNDPLKKAQHEISRLKALLSAAVRKNQQLSVAGGGSPGKGNMDMGMVEQMDAGAQAEAEALRDENLKMAEEISRLREALSKEKAEKGKLMEAIYQSETGGREVNEEGEYTRRDSMAIGSLENLSSNPQAQQRIINAQRNLLEQRQEEIENAQTDQEERWEWLDSYHVWLRNLPVGQMEGGPEGASPGSGAGDGKNPTLYDRLCMMETSVLMQSQELKRTKRLFLRDKERLELQLASALEEVEGRDKIIKDRDKDSEAKLKALLDMEDELKTEIKTLNSKVRGQQKTISAVRDNMERADGSPVQFQGRSSPRASPASLSRKIGFVQGTKPKTRRGTTMGLTGSTRAPVSPKPKKGVALSVGVPESKGPISSQTAMEKISNFSYNHGDNFEATNGGVDEAVEVADTEDADKSNGDDVYAQGMSKYLVQSPSAANGASEHGAPVLQKQSSSTSTTTNSTNGSAPVKSPRNRSSSVPTVNISSSWVEHFDVNHGVPYYHNRITGETTWEPPADWDPATMRRSPRAEAAELK